MITNRKHDSCTLGQLAKQVCASMSRAIQPFHGLEDGDVLYAITTKEVDNRAVNATAPGVLTSELAWDAVLICYAE